MSFLVIFLVGTGEPRPFCCMVGILVLKMMMKVEDLEEILVIALIL